MMKVTDMLRRHIADLLMIRKEDQKSLALYCGKEKSWINKIINGHRDVQMEDLDHIADFFGIATYQLLQPGISQITERRISGDRRSGRDRRIGRQQQELQALGSHINQLRPRQTKPSETKRKA